MQLIFVEAHEDESRPQGGHAVIVIQGLGSLPEKAQFRLKPIDGRTQPGKLNGAKTIPLSPLAIRQTESSIELVAGPDVVSNPLLLAGTPVALEIIDADVRGEFLWPNVAPLTQPRRRKIAAAKKRPEEPTAQSAGTPAVANGTAAELGLLVLEEAERSETPPAFAAPALWTPDAQAGTAAHGVNGAGDASRAIAIEPADASTSGSSPDAAASVAPPASAETQAVIDDIYRPSPPAASTASVQWYRPHDAKVSKQGSRLMPGAAAAAITVLGAYYFLTPRSDTPNAAPPSLTEVTAPVAAAAPSMPPPAATPPAAPPQEPANNGPAAVATLSPAAIAAKPAETCAAPAIATEALDGGRMGLAITAPCLGNADVEIAYGGATFVYRLDGKGTAGVVLDCFAGADKPAEVKFSDGTAKSLPIQANDLLRVSKVAIIWQMPVNLDLHAFEYAALAGQRGHLFEGSPGSESAAFKETEAGPRGRGFMSATSLGKGPGDKVEVYTFINRDDQTVGAIDFAIDYQTRGDAPTAATCAGGSEAEVPYRMSLMVRGKAIGIEKGRIAAAPCGAALNPAVRYGRGALPVLKVRK